MSLGRALLSLVPENPGPGLLAAAEALAKTVADLGAQWQSKEQSRPIQDVRPYDQRLDRLWGAIEVGIGRYSALDAENVDRVRAEQIHGRLFPRGLEFLLLPYMEQHAESERRVELIEDEDLRKDLDRLVGKDFIDEMLAAHEAYGEALGVTKGGKPSPAPISLSAPLRSLITAISNYALQVLAFANLDPEHNNAPARHALEPIDQLRRAMARRKANRGGGEDPYEDASAQPEENADDDPEIAAA